MRVSCWTSSYYLEDGGIMEIKRMCLAELVPSSYNPRKALKSGDREYEKLKRSIAEFGYVDPIIWNQGTGRVVGGHQRLQVLKDMGVEEVEVSVVDLEDEREKALNLALNRITGEWDPEALIQLLEELGETNIDLSLTGFDMSEIEELLADRPAAEVHEDEFDIIEAIESSSEPATRPGDLWILGRHRLLCGDATKAEDYSKLMDGSQASMIFTDPPYNVNYEGGTKEKLTIRNDNLPADSFYRFLLDAFTNCIKVTAPGGAVYVFHADSEGSNFRGALAAAGWLVKQCLIWVKNQLVIGRQDYQWRHEPILYGWKPGAKHQWHGGRKQTTVIDDGARVSIEPHDGFSLITFSTGPESVVLKVPSYEVIFQGDDSCTTVWRVDKPTRNAEHPTMKPVTLPARAIANSCQRGEIVLDPFGGSGSTLIAADQLDRTCFTLELDPVYCDVIAKRYVKWVGSVRDTHLIRDGVEVPHDLSV
jgi:DNA modification methylase